MEPVVDYVVPYRCGCVIAPPCCYHRFYEAKLCLRKFILSFSFEYEVDGLHNRARKGDLKGCLDSIYSGADVNATDRE